MQFYKSARKRNVQCSIEYTVLDSAKSDLKYVVCALAQNLLNSYSKLGLKPKLHSCGFVRRSRIISIAEWLHHISLATTKFEVKEKRSWYCTVPLNSDLKKNRRQRDGNAYTNLEFGIS